MVTVMAGTIVALDTPRHGADFARHAAPVARLRGSGATGAAALSAENAWVVALTLVILPLIVNGTFYLELALGQSIAWVDARLTLRWESIVYLVSATLALAWLAVVHAGIPAGTRAMFLLALMIATAGSLQVLRLG